MFFDLSTSLFIDTVLNSGHMVPMDLPRVAFDLISKFISNQPLNSGVQNLNLKALEPSTIECSNNNNKANKLAKKKIIRGRQSDY